MEQESRVSILDADAYQIIMELYDMEYLSGHVPDDFDMNYARDLIEMHEIRPPTSRVNLHRISDAIAVRYAGLSSHDAVITFLEEAYDLLMGKDRQGGAADVAMTLSAMYIQECFLGYPTDDEDEDENLIWTEPTKSVDTLDLAAEWYIWGVLSLWEACHGRIDNQVDYIHEFYEKRSGKDCKEWDERLLHVAHEIGPDTEMKVEKAIDYRHRRKG